MGTGFHFSDFLVFRLQKTIPAQKVFLNPSGPDITTRVTAGVKILVKMQISYANVGMYNVT